MSLIKDFRDFAFKGNMIDMAVGIVIGGAFGAMVTSLVNDIVMPFIATFEPKPKKGEKPLAWHGIQYGHFAGQVVNFLIVALVMFILIVVVVGKIKKLTSKPAPVAEPTTKECPYCLSTIPIKAARCAHCTSDLTTSAPVAS
ncbi:MAG: large conductance mechanosensitive channel protein MscL [Phycisphaerales bacterium]|nr:large conductance mechanosensitive channel protein MscL [Phycisphaerales bacterium]